MILDHGFFRSWIIIHIYVYIYIYSIVFDRSLFVKIEIFFVTSWGVETYHDPVVPRPHTIYFFELGMFTIPWKICYCSWPTST
jgi:hypothetical protein